MSIARTRNVWLPSSTEYSAGDEHSEKGSVSSEHWNVEPASFETKVKLASSSVVSACGPSRIVATGAVRSASTVHVQVAGVGSTLPAASVARASSVCAPSARSMKTVGSGHGVKPAPSRLHSKVETGSSLSIANVAVVLWLGTFGFGPKTIVVSGGSSSVTVHS